MLNGINIEDVRKYNTSLKQYKDKAFKLNAEIEYTSKTIDTLCKELSNELGIEVNRDNLERIYAEQVEKIESALRSGNAVLSKIAQEEVRVQQMQQTQPVQQVQSMERQVFTQPSGVVTQQPFTSPNGVVVQTQVNNPVGTDGLTGPSFTLEDDDELDEEPVSTDNVMGIPGYQQGMFKGLF